MAVLSLRPEDSVSTASARLGIVTGKDLAQVRKWATILGFRYMGADRADEYGARNGVPGELLVRLRAGHVVAMRDIAD